jgi:hypothetical protein
MSSVNFNVKNMYGKLQEASKQAKELGSKSVAAGKQATTMLTNPIGKGLTMAALMSTTNLLPAQAANLPTEAKLDLTDKASLLNTPNNNRENIRSISQEPIMLANNKCNQDIAPHDLNIIKDAVNLNISEIAADIGKDNMLALGTYRSSSGKNLKNYVQPRISESKPGVLMITFTPVNKDGSENIRGTSVIVNMEASSVRTANNLRTTTGDTFITLKNGIAHVSHPGAENTYEVKKNSIEFSKGIILVDPSCL